MEPSRARSIEENQMSIFSRPFAISTYHYYSWAIYNFFFFPVVKSERGRKRRGSKSLQVALEK